MHGVDAEMPCCYDLQRIFGHEIMRDDRQCSLERAMELLKLTPDRAHDALNDARNTVQICGRMDLDGCMDEYRLRYVGYPEDRKAGLVQGREYASLAEAQADPALTETACPYCGETVTLGQWASSRFQMPEDMVNDRLMVSVHYVDNSMYWSNKIGGEEWLKYIDSQCAELKKAFLDNDIPVFMGETTSTYPASNMAKDATHTDSSECLSIVLGKLTELGIVPVIWDTDSHFYSRTTYKIVNESDRKVIREYSDKLKANLVKRLGAAVLSAVMMLTAVATPLGDNLPAVRESTSLTAGADSYWVGSSTYGYYANNSTALNEVKAIIKPLRRGTFCRMPLWACRGSAPRKGARCAE